jgi:hypothetical protein
MGSSVAAVGSVGHHRWASWVSTSNGWWAGKAGHVRELGKEKLTGPARFQPKSG